MILRKNIQQSWEMRWASPSTPRVLAHDVLNRFDGVANGHGLAGLLVKGGLKFVDGEHEIRARAELFDELEGRAHRVERRNLKNPRIAEVDDALVLIFLQQGFKTARACGPYLVKTSRLRTFSARSRRVSGGWSKATWQMRSKGSRSLPTSSASGSSDRPSFSSSSMMACLRSADFQRLRKSSRLAKRFFSAFLV